MYGNFIEIAQEKYGITPSFGWGMLVYSAAKDVAVSSLTATAINAEITAGTCIGVIKGWNTIAGASVAEKTIERANAQVEKVKSEVLADTLTFTDNNVNQDVLNRISGQTLDVLFIDDMGYVFGNQSLSPSSVRTMKVNFSNKTSNGFQEDQTNEKTVAITARYLLDGKIGYIDAGTEVEDIETKVPLSATIDSITTHLAGSIVFVMNLTNDATDELLTEFTTTSLDVDAKVNGIAVTGEGAFALNQLTVTLTKTVADFNTATDRIILSLSTPEYYLTDIKFNIADFLA